ncbi:unnamed protein product [Clavelina lepadiformis]|uniref:Secreted protein n=1 Tax=Clavelina lepadiformis TaxID=159417 RepID=A0ABP0G9Q2_CLALP
MTTIRFFQLCLAVSFMVGCAGADEFEGSVVVFTHGRAYERTTNFGRITIQFFHRQIKSHVNQPYFLYRVSAKNLRKYNLSCPV